jgi:penicillin amidase
MSIWGGLKSGLGRLTRRKLLRVLLGLVVLVLAGGGLVVLWLQSQVRGSLPPLDGTLHVKGITAPVQVERDNLGIPILHSSNRSDLAYATGFVHGQDRFFQMDLMRRNAAGELAELLGPGDNNRLVERDRKTRLHRFRQVAAQVLDQLDPKERQILTAYVQGVEVGRSSLRKAPFEYLLLNVDPAPWTEMDSVLVLLSMFLMLQGDAFEREAAQGLLRDTLPEAAVAFLSPLGISWDAALDGTTFPDRPIPGPQVWNVRKQARAPRRGPDEELAVLESLDRFSAGSNNWAVSGKLTGHGSALVANDMHLAITIPNIWYRAAFVWPTEDKSGRENHVIGATLPGTPAMIVGSNTHIAWGLTNTEGDWSDLVLLEPDPADPNRYRTPAGARPLEKHTEVIKVKGAADVLVEIEETIWGPVWDRDHRGQRRVLHWVAHDPTAVNMAMRQLETAQSAEESVTIAHHLGSPGLNFVVGDSQGNIAWTFTGRIPRRRNLDGAAPTSWADGRGWDGWLPEKEIPSIINPPSGRLWTANNRVIGGAALAKLGHNSYDNGARAAQIRDQLQARSLFRESDMLAIQLDDRALFLERWQKLLLQRLTPQALDDHPDWTALREKVENWGGRASVDSVGFRVVRRFRQRVHKTILEALTEPCRRADEHFSISSLDRSVEGPVWQLLTERPMHLLPTEYASWDELLLRTVERLAKEIQEDRASLEDGLSAYRWGALNTSIVRHPFSGTSSLLRWWLDLDMPVVPQPGDSSHMPRIHAPLGERGPNHSASQRMAVSPGHEPEGYFHMPCGQSAHPLSPHYRDGHAAWLQGEATPFLPSSAAHVLLLQPEP